MDRTRKKGFSRKEVRGTLFEPRKRAHSPQLDFDELSRVAAGLESVSENGKLPYG